MQLGLCIEHGSLSPFVFWLVCTARLGNWVCYRRLHSCENQPSSSGQKQTKWEQCVTFLTLQQLPEGFLVLTHKEPSVNQEWRRAIEYRAGTEFCGACCHQGAIWSRCSLPCIPSPLTWSFTLRRKPSGLLLGTTCAVLFLFFTSRFIEQRLFHWSWKRLKALSSDLLYTYFKIK